MMELQRQQTPEPRLRNGAFNGQFQPLPAPAPGKLLERCRESQALIERHLPFTRRVLHAGNPVQSARTPFSTLHLVHFGAVKTLVAAADGSSHVAGFHLKGDWVGFDGMISGECACDAYAMDTSEIWSLRYALVLQAAAQVPGLLHALHVAMSGQMAREREWRMALATLPADARLADFLRCWAHWLMQRELRADHVTLRLTRAEIGNYLGMTLETVSRSFSRLALLGLVAFDSKGRRNFAIPDVQALVAFVDARGDS
ncbi:MAG: Crp/Fnr family transcriptional regulator [Rhodoferax sp.]|nr:Crp/Fnr family transcriptional regulator [Rhodoferax sp.]